MKPGSKLRVAAAIFLTLTLSGCGALTARLNKAATVQGEARAGVNLPDWPAWCEKHGEHAALIPNTDIRIILDEERAGRKEDWSRIAACANYYRSLQKKMAKIPAAG